jgi:S-adenosylmethionine decarboxylase
MPAKSLPSGQRPAAGKLLCTLDAVLTPASPVTDISELTALATAAVTAGHGNVLSTSQALFPNGAVTLVLILAESHLAIHTWPEERLIAIDLFSCGSIDAQRVAAELARLLRLDAAQVQWQARGQVAVTRRS